MSGETTFNLQHFIRQSLAKILPGVAPVRSVPGWLSEQDPASHQERPRLQLSEAGKARRARRQREAEPVPVATYLLLAVIVIVYYLMWKAGNGRPELVAREFGGKDNELILAGQWWRFVTPVFLHGSNLHLLTNSLSLYWFGTQLERFYGWRKYLLIFILAGIAGNLASFLLTPAPSLGASGALFGLVGAGLIFPIRFRSLVPEKARNYILSQLLLITIVNLGLGFSIAQVDNWAHMGGLVGGSFVALFLLPEGLEREPPGRAKNSLVTLSVAGALLLVGVSVYAQWRWATEVAAPQLVTYGSDRTDAWWSVRVPKRWQFQKTKGAWISPEGAILQIADSDHNPNLVQYVLIRMAQINQQAPRQVNSLLIDGKEAKHLQLQKGPNIEDVFLVLVEERQLAIILQHREKDTLATDYDIKTILGSIRFTLPPHSVTSRPSQPLWPVPTD